MTHLESLARQVEQQEEERLRRLEEEIDGPFRNCRALFIYVLLAFSILYAVATKADVCTSTNCATKKPLSAMVSTDPVLWCDGSYSGSTCSKILPLTWGGTSGFTVVLTDTGYFPKDKIPATSVPVPVPPPSAPYVVKPASCFPKPLGSGSSFEWEALAKGDNRLTKPSVFVYACNDGYTYQQFAYAGNYANKAEEIGDALVFALKGNTMPLYALTVSGVSRPLTDPEKLKRDELYKALNLPPLWIVKASTTTSRPAYKLTNGLLGSQVGKVETGKPCDCKLRYTNSTSTYCGVSDQLNYGTQTKLPADAVTICARQ